MHLQLASFQPLSFQALLTAQCAHKCMPSTVKYGPHSSRPWFSCTVLSSPCGPTAVFYMMRQTSVCALLLAAASLTLGTSAAATFPAQAGDVKAWPLHLYPMPRGHYRPCSVACGCQPTESPNAAHRATRCSFVAA